MIAISTILVPIVLSPPGEWAARYAVQLAKKLGSKKVVFLHAGTCSQESVEAFVKPLVANSPHEVVVRTGDPAETIVHFTRALPADLIVMPTHSGGRFRRFLLGSVTAKVLHDADCPVLTGVHREDLSPEPPAGIQSIVCAVDTDESFAPVVRCALDFQALFGARLTLVHAVPAADETSDSRGETDIRRFLFDRAAAKFDALRREAGLDAAVTISGGPVHRVIREAALQENADLVIIGRGHTQRGMGRLRTHAYAIIRNSPCPVLSI
jgi:nucleotide-binding universal stress UspA family protein